MLKSFGVWLTVLTLISAGGNLCIGGEELVVNPGFEELVVKDGNELVKGWRRYVFGADQDQEFEIIKDAAQSHSGEICIRMKTDSKAVAALGSGTKVVPGEKYLYKVWAKGEEGSKLTLTFHAYDEQGKNVGSTKELSKVVMITSEWKEYQNIVSIESPEIALVAPTIVLGGGAGLIYIDDVSLQEVDG